FDIKKLKLSAPSKPRVDLTKIHNSQNILGLVLTFYISFALSARKTALILKSVFNIDISFQTVLNYAEAAAYYCHPFNLQNKGPIDNICPGDETYIKIRKKNYYVYFFISSKSLKITSYHVADSRGVLPATTSMLEAVRTASPEQEITLVTDGNPSYPAGIHFINSINPDNKDILFRKVVGLQNLDSESEEFRPYKQIIERLNRTYKHHIKPSHTFNSFNGPVALTTLFVTHYNFLRPHYSLNSRTPIRLPELKNISTIQGKWLKILSLAQPDAA
ncbi:MAG: DDE-type integrase/transposase/recombinase, partial [Candidatus Margulisbacteria bacterium]|nr:DDE-type integrase/transposase/recombinase [Candidatus Margulisiibacteriota bacterium]